MEMLIRYWNWLVIFHMGTWPLHVVETHMTSTVYSFSAIMDYPM